MALQRRATSDPGRGVAPPIVHDVLRSPGKPLDDVTRAMFEPRFGWDFSHVRVHTDARAAESARAVNALAYTVGRNIVFGQGQHSPHTSAGRHLLAHELVHVVQQRGQSISSQAPLVVNQPGDVLEKESQRVVDSMSLDRAPLHLAVHGVKGLGTPPAEENPLAAGIHMSSRCDRAVLSRAKSVAISALGYPMIQREAHFVDGPVNLAFGADIMLGLSTAGVTDPILNGTPLIGGRQKAQALAVSSMNGPEIDSSATGTGTQCWIKSVPFNEGSFQEFVPSNGPWRMVTKPGPLADAFDDFPLPNCRVKSQDATVNVHGLPSDADFQEHITEHEDHHANDIKSMFRLHVMPWDFAMRQAAASKQMFQGADLPACQASLFAAMGGSPGDIATTFFTSVLAAGAAFHRTAAGKGIDIANAKSDANCNVVDVSVSP
jgi:hypothetical protein